MTTRPLSVSPIRLGATVEANWSVKVLLLRRPAISAWRAVFVARSTLTWSTSVLSTAPLSGPPPRATPTASARKTETMETMW